MALLRRSTGRTSRCAEHERQYERDRKQRRNYSQLHGSARWKTERAEFLSKPENARHGIHVYHPSCAQRASTIVDKPAAPRVIGHLRGCALTIDSAGCHIINRDGSDDHEAFTLDVFDASLQAGGQVLRACGHDSLPLRGRFTRLNVDARRLVFDFVLTDGIAERATFERVRRGDLRGCSIEFEPGECHYRDRILTHRRAKLIGIALTNKPQWFGTYVIAAEAA